MVPLDRQAPNQDHLAPLDALDHLVSAEVPERGEDQEPEASLDPKGLQEAADRLEFQDLTDCPADLDPTDDLVQMDKEFTYSVRVCAIFAQPLLMRAFTLCRTFRTTGCWRHRRTTWRAWSSRIPRTTWNSWR